MDINSDQFLIYAGCLIIVMAAAYYFTQWVHQIHKRNRLLEAQVKLLSKIAEKSGVNNEEIEAINQAAETRHQPLS